MIIVLKKNTERNLTLKWLYLNLRYINILLSNDKYLISLIKDILKILIGIVIFTILYLLSIYYRFQIKLENRYKIVFI